MSLWRTPPSALRRPRLRLHGPRRTRLNRPCAGNATRWRRRSPGRPTVP